VATYPVRMLSLFSGADGLDLGIRIALPGVRTLCYVERELAACQILAARMADGSAEPAPIFTDVGPTADANTATYSNGARGPNLREAAGNWTTPQSHDMAPGDPNRVGRYGTEHGGRNLTDDVMLWPTPQTRDEKNPDQPESGNFQRKVQAGWTIDLGSFAPLWYTPNTPNGGRSVPADVVESKGKTDDGKRQVGLESQTKFWRSPTACSENSLRGSGQSASARAEQGHTVNLQDQVADFSLPDPQTAKDGQNSCGRTRTSRLRLNPAFVCLLMGWPWWLTRPEPISFARREMESWLSAQRSHLRSLLTARGLTCRNSGGGLLK